MLASYARDGLARVEAAGDAPSLAAVRSALEEALGVRFEGNKGARFFHSTLVQTLFYGVFSAWVLWARQTPPPTGVFNWREARSGTCARQFCARCSSSFPIPVVCNRSVWLRCWTGHPPRSTGLTAPPLFTRFREGEAVPYFYEPFLEAFDPELRKQLGVWYTPVEVVHYMVGPRGQGTKRRSRHRRRARGGKCLCA